MRLLDRIRLPQVALQVVRDVRSWIVVLTMFMALFFQPAVTPGVFVLSALAPLLSNLFFWKRVQNSVWTVPSRSVVSDLLQPWVIGHLVLYVFFALPVVLVMSLDLRTVATWFLAGFSAVLMGASMALEGDSGSVGTVHLAALGAGLLAASLVFLSPVFFLFIVYGAVHVQKLSERRLLSARSSAKVLDDALV